MLDRRQDPSERHILHMRLRSELLPVEEHLDAPCNSPAERSGKEVGHFQAAVVDPIATATS